MKKKVFLKGCPEGLQPGPSDPGDHLLSLSSIHKPNPLVLPKFSHRSTTTWSTSGALNTNQVLKVVCVPQGQTQALVPTVRTEADPVPLEEPVQGCGPRPSRTTESQGRRTVVEEMEGWFLKWINEWMNGCWMNG